LWSSTTPSTGVIESQADWSPLRAHGAVWRLEFVVFARRNLLWDIFTSLRARDVASAQRAVSVACYECFEHSACEPCSRLRWCAHLQVRCLGARMGLSPGTSSEIPRDHRAVLQKGTET
jgi:hypothetical protein